MDAARGGEADEHRRPVRELLYRLSGCGTAGTCGDELLAQQIYGLALGYEDLNDHEELWRDPLLAVLVEKEDLTGKDRRRVRDQGTALAGKSTLNRMELGAAKLGEKERYKKIILDEAAVDRTLVDIFLQAQGEAAKEIVLDLVARTFPCTGSKKSGSSTATTDIIATCRCTSSVASMGCVPACGRPISTGPKAAWRSWNGLWHRSGKRGLKSGSSGHSVFYLTEKEPLTAFLYEYALC
jgi:Transposase DDE domain group 1